ncbi:MAG: tetratricopeptide repeat protein, partial [Verrucomicrobiota bacterium]
MPLVLLSTLHRTSRLLTAGLALGFILGCAEKEPSAEEILAEAAAISASGRVGEAISLLEIHNQANPGNFAIVEALAFAYIQADDPATGAMYFARAAQIDPSQAEYLLMVANAWQSADDLQSAIALYQEYVRARPEDLSARLTLASLQEQAGNLDDARDTLLATNRREPNATAQLRIAELFLRGGNLAQAQQWFDSAARFGGETRDEALLGLLEVVLRGNRFADALALMNVLDEEFPGRLEDSDLAGVRTQLEAWQEQQDAVLAAARGFDSNRRLPTSAPARERDRPSERDRSTQPSTPPPSARAPEASDLPPTTRPTASTARPNGPTLPSEETEDNDVETPEPPDKEELVTAVERRIARQIAAREDEDPVDAEAASLGDAPLDLFPGDDDPAGAPLPTLAPLNYQGFVAAAREAMDDEAYREAIRQYHRALARSSQDAQIWSELSEAQFRAGETVTAPASAAEATRRAPQNPRFRLQYLRVAQGVLSPDELIQTMEEARRDFPTNP